MKAPVHIGVRGIVIVVVALIAMAFVLQWARLFFIPLIFSILIAYTLAPIVAWLEKFKIPRIIGVSSVLFVVLFALAVAANSLKTEFQSILVRLPEAVHQISTEFINPQDGRPTTMQQVQAAATEIERVSSQATDVLAGPVAGTGKKVQTVVIARPEFHIQDWLWAGSMGILGWIGQAIMVVFLVFFLLMSGDRFKRKLVKISGPSLSSKKITIHILSAIDQSIQGYMLMQLATNLLFALLLWIAFRWIGLENAGAWAATAGFLHIIPYVGPMVITVVTGLTAYVQFGSAATMFLVAGISIAVSVLVGTFLTTWMAGRIAKMNAASVFIGLFFWGWLWGIWGLLLGLPIIVIARVIADHVNGLQPLAEMLGE